MNKLHAIDIPEWLKPRSASVQKVPATVRIVSILVAMTMIVSAVIWIVADLRKADSGSIVEHSVQASVGDYRHTIMYEEPQFSVVRAVSGNKTSYFIFDNNGNMVYPETITKGELDEQREISKRINGT